MSKRDIVILCGACQGEEIPKIRALNSRSIIYAIEPVPENVTYLRNKYGSEPNIVIIQKAVWSSDGVKNIRNYSYSYKHSFYNRPLDKDLFKGYLRVKTIDFSNFLKKFERVCYIRMNIEGSEYQVLHHCFNIGAMEIVRFLDLELHSNKIPELLQLEKSLVRKLNSWGKRGERWIVQKEATTID